MSFSDLVAQSDRAAQSLLGGDVVTYAPTGGPVITVTGMFDEQFVLAKGSPEAGVEASGPAVFLRLEDLPRDPELEDDGLTLTIRAVQYRLIERHPDGLGGVLLMLRAR